MTVPPNPLRHHGEYTVMPPLVHRPQNEDDHPQRRTVPPNPLRHHGEYTVMTPLVREARRSDSHPQRRTVPPAALRHHGEYTVMTPLVIGENIRHLKKEGHGTISSFLRNHAIVKAARWD